MNKEIMNPLLRQAIIIANPNYFLLNIDAQEKYGVSVPEKDRFLIDQFLFKRLFGIQVNNQEQLYSAHDRLRIHCCPSVKLPVSPAPDNPRRAGWQNPAFPA